MGAKMRYARVELGGLSDLVTVRRYLPDNYKAALVKDEDGSTWILIHGVDDHGWTLDEYVIPRLASGCISATEAPACFEPTESMRAQMEAGGSWLVTERRIEVFDRGPVRVSFDDSTSEVHMDFGWPAERITIAVDGRLWLFMRLFTESMRAAAVDVVQHLLSEGADDAS